MTWNYDLGSPNLNRIYVHNNKLFEIICCFQNISVNFLELILANIGFIISLAYPGHILASLLASVLDPLTAIKLSGLLSKLILPKCGHSHL